MSIRCLFGKHDYLIGSKAYRWIGNVYHATCSRCGGEFAGGANYHEPLHRWGPMDEIRKKEWLEENREAIL